MEQDPSQQNPYATPRAQATRPGRAHVKPTLAQLLFSTRGRVPRRVYWAVMLGMLVPVILFAVGLAMFEERQTESARQFEGFQYQQELYETEPASSSGFGLTTILIGVVAIPMLWIHIAVTVKRWHDRDKSGWFYLVRLIPYVGGIWTLVECGCLRGTIGDNDFGPDPT